MPPLQNLCFCPVPHVTEHWPHPVHLHSIGGGVGLGHLVVGAGVGFGHLVVGAGVGFGHLVGGGGVGHSHQLQLRLSDFPLCPPSTQVLVSNPLPQLFEHILHPPQRQQPLQPLVGQECSLHA